MMTKYTDHEHEWKVDYNAGSLFSIQCSKCHIIVELYAGHLSLTDYTRGSDLAICRHSMQYDELLTKP